MYVQIMKACVTAVLALFSLTPAWCDSCGEIALVERAQGYYTQAQTCEACGAMLCGHCADTHEHQ